MKSFIQTGVAAALMAAALTTALPSDAASPSTPPKSAQASEINWQSYQGKVVLVDFWASWCLPCRQLMPQMAALQEQNPDLVVVAVSVDASREKALTFLRAVEPTLRAVHDADHKVADAYVAHAGR